MHDLIIKNNSQLKLGCFTNTETNHIFNGEAQTPTCYFSLQKTSHSENLVSIYNKKTTHFEELSLLSNISIPLCYTSIIQKLLSWVDKVGCINVIKTSMRPGYKGLKTSANMNKEYPYMNIKTCTFKFNEQYTASITN